MGLEKKLAKRGCPVEFLIWPDVPPAAGRPQQVIFDHFPVETWDIFIGLLWNRFGSPSGEKDDRTDKPMTGTEEEFKRAYVAWKASGGRRPHIAIYRCERPQVTRGKGLQIAAVDAFFDQLAADKDHPALSFSFTEPHKFKDDVEEHLVEIIGNIHAAEKADSEANRKIKTVPKITVNWVAAEESYCRHLCDVHRIVKFHTAAARTPVEVELEKVFIRLTARRKRQLPFGGDVISDLEAILAEAEKIPGASVFKNVSAHEAERIAREHGFSRSLAIKVMEGGLFFDDFKTGLQRIDLSGTVTPTSLPDLLRQHRNLALAGSPGSGKSTLLQYLALTYASQQQESRLQLEKPRLPVLIRLRQFHLWLEGSKKLGELKSSHFHQFLTHQWKEDEAGAPELPKGFFLRLLRDDRALILLDGLDEISEPAERRAIAALVATALDDWREARVIITSRPRAWESEGRVALGSRVGEAHICDLDDTQVEEFVRHWYLSATIAVRGDSPITRSHAKSRAVDLIAAVKPERIRKLANTPLMLSILAMVHSRGVGLPQERSQLYHECIEFMLGYWDEIAGFSPDTELIEVARLDRQTKRQLLEPVALWMHRLGSGQIAPLHDDLVKQFATGFASVLNEPHPAAERHARAFLRLIVERGGLMQESEVGQFRFVHLTFQEYLAASAIARGKSPFSQVEHYLHDHWWREVILLAGGELSRQPTYLVRPNTTAWLTGILTADTWAEEYLLRDLQLAARSCAEMSETGIDANVSAKIANQLIEAILDWWAQIPVENLSSVIRELPAGHLTRAIASALPTIAPRGKFRELIPALAISHLLPDAVIDAPLIAAFIERSADENSYTAWDAVLLTLNHGTLAEGQVAIARFQAGAASGDWPISAEETSKLFLQGHRDLEEAALAVGRNLIAAPPTNQSVGWTSLLVRHGTEEDRRVTLEKLMAHLEGTNNDRLARAMHELSKIPEFVDREAIGVRLKTLIKHLGNPSESTRGYNLQTGAVRLWSELAERATPVDYTPVLLLALGLYYEHFEEAFVLVLKHGSVADREAVRANLHRQMAAAPAWKSSAILIFLLRFDPDADFTALATWVENLAAKNELPVEWRVWDVLRFLGEKAWNCPRSIQRLINEAQAKGPFGRICLTQLGLLLRTYPANSKISVPPFAQLAKDAIHFAQNGSTVECVAALCMSPELRTRWNS